ncbi:hypothetical protein PIB30_056945 [Stylosanthes scabra]|uniref:Uncharacterized protein n=1 Tax=Stylosanthes scabra TaxID=79078 RepID=A0ABU6UKC3_9FABA|nr:hypothetical protein [Stylosanthes scabra]
MEGSTMRLGDDAPQGGDRVAQPAAISGDWDDCPDDEEDALDTVIEGEEISGVALVETSVAFAGGDVELEGLREQDVRNEVADFNLQGNHLCGGPLFQHVYKLNQFYFNPVI